MTLTRNGRCLAYGATALLALLGTWTQALSFIPRDRALLSGFVAGTRQFWIDALATPASTFLTVDIFLFGLAVTLLMVVEARRLGIPYVWMYVIAGLLVAISATVPLFLIARERRLAARGEGADAIDITAADACLLGILTVAFAGVTVWTMVR